MAVKYLSIRDFTGGIASIGEKKDFPNSAKFTKALNPFEDTSYITLSRKTTKDSGSSVTDLPLVMESVDDELYLYGDTGKLYVRDNGGTYTEIRDVFNSVGNGMVFFDDYLYYMRNTTPGRYGPFSGTKEFSDNFLGQADNPTNTHSLDLELSSSQHAAIADGSQTGLDLSTDFTIEFWINLEQLPSTAGSNFTIVAKDNVGGSRAYAINIRSANNKLRAFFTDGANNTVFDMDEAFDSNDLGNWIHIAVSVDISAPTMSFYKDGVSKSGTSSDTSATTINNSTTSFYIGSRETSGTPGEFFDGKIDDVRVWSNIRTASEISSNYDSDINSAESNLVAYYKLNNDYTDETSNGNDLTASGSPVFSTNVPFSGGAIGSDRNDFDQGLDASGQTYTLPTTFTEASTDKQEFTPQKDPQYSVEVNISAVGTGDWTMTIHDSQDTEIVSKTVSNANLATGDFEFEFTSWRPVIGKSYHFHLTSSTGDGSVVTQSSGDLNTADFHTYYQFFVNVSSHPAINFLNFSLWGNERYVAKWDGVTYTPDVLTLPPNFIIRDFALYKEFLVIVAYKGESIDKAVQGRLYYWDGIEDDFNYFEEITFGAPNCIHNSRGELIGVYGSDGSLYAGASEFREVVDGIPKLAKGKKLEVYANAIEEFEGRTLIGVSGSTDDGTSLEQGVYEYGSQHTSLPDILNFPYQISTGNTQSTGISIGCIKSVGTDLFIGWKDSSTYGVDIVSLGDNASTSGSWESLIFDGGDPNAEFLPLNLTVSVEPLQSGESVTPKYKLDRASSFTTGTTQSTTGAIKAEEPIYTRCKEIEFGFNVTSSNGTFPKITQVVLEYDDLSDERRE